jgi:hypothetical protein
MQVKTRLVLFVLALLCLLLVLGGLAARQLSAMRDVVARVAEQSVGQMDQASRLQGDFNSLRIVSYRHVMELDVDRELPLRCWQGLLQQIADHALSGLLQPVSLSLKRQLAIHIQLHHMAIADDTQGIKITLQTACLIHLPDRLLCDPRHNITHGRQLACREAAEH